MEEKGKKKGNPWGLIWVGKAACAGCAAFLVLNLFAFFYYNPGGHITNPTGATDYTWAPNTFFARMTEGITFGRFDQEGFNNRYPASPDGVDILLMGSSHMEAMQMPQDKNVGYLLNALLDRAGQSGGYVYNIGTAGHGLPDCVSNLPYAMEHYGPSRAVILETATLEFSDALVTRVLEGTRVRAPSYDSGWIHTLQKVPYLKLLHSQMKSVGGGEAEPAPPAAAATAPPEAVDALMRQAAEAVGERALILLYHPAVQVDKNGDIFTTTDPAARAAVAAACEYNGIVFLDMTQRFLQTYQAEHILPHGFANTAVGAGHLNQNGHKMIAEALAEILEETERPA